MTVPMDLQPAGLGPAKIGRRGLMLVLSSPSGAGKTTIARRMLQRNSNLTLSVSVTTRPMRPGEADGVDYHFVDHATFERMVVEKQLLEHARVFGNYYGTPRAPVELALSKGREILFDIDGRAPSNWLKTPATISSASTCCRLRRRSWNAGSTPAPRTAPR